MVKLSSKTLALVVNAIKNMRESKGSTSRDILNYISSVHDIPQDVAKRQMVAALKRGVAHGIIKKTDRYYSLPTDTEVECMEVAAQELGLLDLCCRKKKREARKSKGAHCKPKALKRKRRSSRKSKRGSKGCKSRSRRKSSRSRKRKSKRGCGCAGKLKRRSGRSKGRRSKSGGKPKRKSRRSKHGKREEKKLEDENKCRSVTLNVDAFDDAESHVRRNSRSRSGSRARSTSRARSKSRSRSRSRNRNVIQTA